MKEEWRPVLGYEGCYEVSSFGEVRSLDRIVSNGAFWKGRIRKQGLNAGYPSVTLVKDGKKKAFRTHKVVLEAFVGPRPEGKVACHNDGNKNNNSITNLRWDTQKSNIRDCVNHGTHSPGKCRGEKHGNSKLCELDVWIIRNADLPNYALCEFFGVSSSTICGIRKGISWQHV